MFRQGEPGLSLFTVDKGELDVVKEHAGVRRTVARLSPGMCVVVVVVVESTYCSVLLFSMLVCSTLAR